MPVIPFQRQPEVAPEGAPGVFRREQATPGAFGAYRAAGLERVGAAGVQLGEALATNAIRFQQQQNETDVDAANTAFEAKKRSMLFDPGGFYDKKGKDAYDSMNPTAKAIEDLRTEARNGLANPQQQRMFDVMSRRATEMDLRSMSRHAATENQVYRVGVAEAAIKNAQDESAAYWNDPYRFALSVGNIKVHAENRARLMGRTDPEQVKADVQHFVGQAWVARIKATMQHDPVAAEEMYRANAGEIGDLGSKVQLEHELKSAVLPVEAKNDAAAILAGGTLNPDKNGPMLVRVAAAEGGEPGAAAPTSKAATKGRLGDWISTAEQVAERRHPGDPVYRDLLMTQIKGYVNTIVAAQQGVALQAHSTLLTAAMGQGGTKPLTLDELLRAPETRAAWALTDPASQRGILALLEHNAKEAEGRPLRTNPKVFEDLFARVHLPNDDPRKISQPGQLAPYFAKGLNRTDYDWLKKEIEQGQTADGQRLSETRNNFLTAVKPQFDKSTMLKLDEKGGEDFYKFKTYVLEQERKARAGGEGKEAVDPYELYNPQSEHYLGKQIPAFQRSLEQKLHDMAETLKPPATLPPEQQRKPGETIEQYRERMKLK